MSHRAKPGEVQDAILDALARSPEPMSPTELHEATGHKLGSVKVAVTRMERDGQLEKEHGSYSIRSGTSYGDGADPVMMAREAPASTPYRRPASGGAQIIEITGPLGTIVRFTVHMEQVGPPIQVGLDTHASTKHT